MEIENRKLKQMMEEKNDYIESLKSEISKFKILTYAKSNVSQARSSMFEYKRKIKNIFERFNLELNKVKYGLVTIVIKNKSLEEENTPISIQYNAPIVEISDVDKCLFYKDKISLADHKYHSFRSGMNLKQNMVPLRQVKKRKLEINSDLIAIELSTGYYLDPIKYIKLRISFYLKNLISGDTNDKKILIKLSCDGTRLSRNVTIVNFVFSIINEKIKAASASGCYRIGAFRITKEDYESIKEWLPTLWQKIKVLKRINYNSIDHEISDSPECLPADNNTYEIEYCFGADYKMMLIVLGLQGAHSNHPCYMCEQESGKLENPGKYVVKKTL
jgi:hypothetical protein